MGRRTAEEGGLQPLGRPVGYAFAGVEPRYIGIGRVPAVRNVLDQAGLSIHDMDLFELNEAFVALAPR